jgi:hypothetical protein
VYAATLALLPAGGLWTVDNGNKRIQVEALLASGFRDFSLPWPGQQLDPELAFNPLPGPFSVVREGRLYSVFSPVFPALSVLPFRVRGRRPCCCRCWTPRCSLSSGESRISPARPGLSSAIPPASRPRLVLCRRLWERRRSA